jgi:hypothetical protein
MTTPRLGRQSREILARLLNGDRLTSRDAALEMSVWRLAARVKDLRLAGWNVVSERVSDNERTYAQYHIPLGRPRIEDRQGRLFGEVEDHE